MVSRMTYGVTYDKWYQKWHVGVKNGMIWRITWCQEWHEDSKWHMALTILFSCDVGFCRFINISNPSLLYWLLPRPVTIDLRYPWVPLLPRASLAGDQPIKWILEGFVPRMSSFMKGFARHSFKYMQLFTRSLKKLLIKGEKVPI